MVKQLVHTQFATLFEFWPQYIQLYLLFPVTYDDHQLPFTFNMTDVKGIVHK